MEVLLLQSLVVVVHQASPVMLGKKIKHDTCTNQRTCGAVGVCFTHDIDVQSALVNPSIALSVAVC